MKKIEAYQCEITRGVFEDPRRAVSSEFRALMKRAGATMPAMGSVSSIDIMGWLAGVIEGEIYPNALGKLTEALDYYTVNREIITGREAKNSAAS